MREGEEVEAEGSGRTRRRIQWAEDVVDNEGMGKKKSKGTFSVRGFLERGMLTSGEVCCIYHAPKGIDESSDESSSDGDSDSESGDDGSARPTRRGHGHGHGDHDHDHGHGKGKGGRRERSPNAYEKIPKVKGSGTKQKD